MASLLHGLMQKTDGVPKSRVMAECLPSDFLYAHLIS